MSNNFWDFFGGNQDEPDKATPEKSQQEEEETVATSLNEEMASATTATTSVVTQETSDYERTQRQQQHQHRATTVYDDDDDDDEFESLDLRSSIGESSFAGEENVGYGSLTRILCMVWRTRVVKPIARRWNHGSGAPQAPRSSDDTIWIVTSVLWSLLSTLSIILPWILYVVGLGEQAVMRQESVHLNNEIDQGNLGDEEYHGGGYANETKQQSSSETTAASSSSTDCHWWQFWGCHSDLPEACAQALADQQPTEEYKLSLLETLQSIQETGSGSPVWMLVCYVLSLLFFCGLVGFFGYVAWLQVRAPRHAPKPLRIGLIVLLLVCAYTCSCTVLILLGSGVLKTTRDQVAGIEVTDLSAVERTKSMHWGESSYYGQLSVLLFISNISWAVLCLVFALVLGGHMYCGHRPVANAVSQSSTKTERTWGGFLVVKEREDDPPTAHHRCQDDAEGEDHQPELCRPDIV